MCGLVPDSVEILDHVTKKDFVLNSYHFGVKYCVILI